MKMYREMTHDSTADAWQFAGVSHSSSTTNEIMFLQPLTVYE